MSNTFQYKQVWTSEYEKSNWSMPVYPVIADLQFTAGLKVGDQVNRRYRSNPIFAKTMSSAGAYSVQNYTEAEESFTISKLREASVRIVNAEVLMHDLDTTKSYGSQLSNALFNEIDGDTLYTAYAGAGTTIDDGSFAGGTAGNGLTVSSGNITDIPPAALEIFTGKNVVYNNNIRFGKLPFEDYGGMLTMIIPPQVNTEIQKYMLSRGTPLGDQVVTNGYRGRFGDFEVFVSNNLTFSSELMIGTLPTDGDTFTIKGVTFRMKDTIAANGDIDIGAGTIAECCDNIVSALNAPTTASATFDCFVDGTDTLTENGYTINKSDALHGLVATDGTTHVDFYMKGTGKVTLSETFVTAGNEFTTAKRIVHGLIMVGKNVSLAVRKDPGIYENFVSEAVAKDYIMWTVYDNKVFADQARAIIDLAIRADSSSFTAYSNVHA